ncbi:MAG: glutaredoxin [Thermotaleaceae bacterium]
MKPVLLFILESCPFCKEALTWMDELKQENPKYADVAFTIVDEKKEPDLANAYDYYFVPTYYIEDVKVHEGIASKDMIREVFEKALK